MDRNPIPARQQNRCFDHILEFAYISNPVVSDQALQRILRDRLYRFRDLLSVIFEKMIHQKRDILSAVPKCGDVESDWAEALAEAIAKPAFGGIVFEVASRSRDDSEIYGAGFRRRHRLDLFILQYAEDLVLNGKR